MTIIAFILPILFSTTAVTVEQQFAPAMTNGLGWSWNEKVKRNNSGYFIGAQGAMLVSPIFDFAITSATLIYRKSSSCTRDIRFDPGNQASAPSEQEGAVTATWASSSEIRQFTIRSESGSQNLYLVSITVSGERLPEKPTDLHVVKCDDTSCTLAWNGASENYQVCLESILRESSEYVFGRHYDFMGYTNQTTRIRACDEDFWSRYEEFSGTRVYIPPGETNAIQLSSSEEIGSLVYCGLTEWSHITLVAKVKRPDANGESSDLNFAWILDDQTNDFASVKTTTEFTPHTVELFDMPENSQLLINSSGNRGNHRVLIESLDFYYDYFPGGVYTNFISETTVSSMRCTFDALDPQLTYVVTVCASCEESLSQPATLEFRARSRKTPLTLLLR